MFRLANRHEDIIIERYFYFLIITIVVRMEKVADEIYAKLTHEGTATKSLWHSLIGIFSLVTQFWSNQNGVPKGVSIELYIIGFHKISPLCKEWRCFIWVKISQSLIVNFLDFSNNLFNLFETSVIIKLLFLTGYETKGIFCWYRLLLISLPKSKVNAQRHRKIPLRFLAHGYCAKSSLSINECRFYRPLPVIQPAANGSQPA